MMIEQLSRLEVGPLDLPAYEGWELSVHELSLSEVLAVKTAVASGRPLLVRGEPGTGKTQFARAVAVALGRHFLSHALDAHTEARDLFWTLDAVRRLSEAQLLAATFAHAHWTKQTVDPQISNPQAPSSTSPEALADRLAESRFVEPGILWWAFDWPGASLQHQHCRGGPERPHASWVDPASTPGTVVLLDEIDKADPVLPNALLEALGAGRFDGPLGCGPVSVGTPPPLVIITTNEERALPKAFMRRCAVLKLGLPEGEALKEMLIARGALHGKMYGTPPTPDVLQRCADALIKDRQVHQSADAPRPGQAEFLDLLRAVCRLKTDNQERLDLLDQLRPFVLEKQAWSSGLT